MNEQVGFPYNRQQRRIPPKQQPIPANNHRAGHYSGIHPEDQPYMSQEFADDTEYDDRVPMRTATSVRRYQTTEGQPPVIPLKKKRRIVVHNDAPPEGYTTRTPRREEPEERVTPQKTRRRIHWLVYVGGAMLIMIVGWIILSDALAWGAIQLDTLHYGMPRTFQTDAVVGHHDSPTNPTHFIALNLNGHVEIIEIQGGDPAHSVIYPGPNLLGQDAQFAPVTLTFDDVNGDGKIAMQVHVLGETVTYLNDGTKFVPPRQS